MKHLVQQGRYKTKLKNQYVGSLERYSVPTGLKIILTRKDARVQVRLSETDDSVNNSLNTPGTINVGYEGG